MSMIANAFNAAKEITVRVGRQIGDFIGAVKIGAIKTSGAAADFVKDLPTAGGVIAVRLALSTIPRAFGYNKVANFIGGVSSTKTGMFGHSLLNTGLFSFVLGASPLTTMALALPASLLVSFVVLPLAAAGLQKIPGFGWLGRILVPSKEKKTQAPAPRRGAPQAQPVPA